MSRTLLLILGAVMLATGCTPKEAAPPLKPGAVGHIVIGPYVQPANGPLDDNLRVVWWTDEPGPAKLQYRSQGAKSFGTKLADDSMLEGLHRHVAEVSDIDNVGSMEVMAEVTVGGKRYSSAVVPLNFPGSDEGKPFRFAALGDTGAGTESERAVVRQVAAKKPELLVITGDVVYDSGEFDEYRKRFFPYFGDLMRTVPILPVMGNHDTGNPANMGQPFCDVWTPPDNMATLAARKPPYTVLKRRANNGEGPVSDSQQALRNYSTDARDCHFVGLDTSADHDTIRDFIVPWLKKDLATAKKNGAKWIIAFWHHPPYTHGGYRDNSLQWGDVRELLVPVLREAGVQLVLNGHDHNYQHMKKDGIDYIVTGAGGAKLYPVVKDYTANDQPPLLASNDQVHSFTLFEESADGSKMVVRQIDETGHQLDVFSLSH